MAAIVNAIVEDIAAVFIIALAIVTIAVITWGSLQVIENMPLGEEKTEAKKTIEHISATGILVGCCFKNCFYCYLFCSP